MRTVRVALAVLCVAMAGCAESGEELDEEIDESPIGPTSPEASATPTTPAATRPTVAPATPPTTTTGPSSAPTPATHTARVTDGPAGDVDRDGIPDAHETSLASNCSIAGRTCASLGIAAPEVGLRDLVFVQVGRSGTEQDWRLPSSVWNSTVAELASHSIRAQIADIGKRDDIDVQAAWDDTANAGRYWHLWVLYDDPATAATTETSGSQTYDLIKIAERENDAEMRATILHEAYHALLGELRGGKSACAHEEIGGPGHSSDPNSVLYTSPDCETNEGSIYRLSSAEANELREEAFDVFRQMNANDWFAQTET